MYKVIGRWCWGIYKERQWWSRRESRKVGTHITNIHFAATALWSTFCLGCPVRLLCFLSLSITVAFEPTQLSILQDYHTPFGIPGPVVVLISLHTCSFWILPMSLSSKIYYFNTNTLWCSIIGLSPPFHCILSFGEISACIVILVILCMPNSKNTTFFFLKILIWHLKPCLASCLNFPCLTQHRKVKHCTSHKYFVCSWFMSHQPYSLALVKLWSLQNFRDEWSKHFFLLSECFLERP